MHSKLFYMKTSLVTQYILYTYIVVSIKVVRYYVKTMENHL